MRFDRASTRHDKYAHWLEEVKGYSPARANKVVEELRNLCGLNNLSRPGEATLAIEEDKIRKASK